MLAVTTGQAGDGGGGSNWTPVQKAKVDNVLYSIGGILGPIFWTVPPPAPMKITISFRPCLHGVSQRSLLHWAYPRVPCA